MGSNDDEANPNLTDVPSETAHGSRDIPRDEVQQVMGAQSAKAKATKAPVVLNGTYGAVGPMTLDDEVRQPLSVPGNRSEAAGSEAGRTGQGSGVSSLRLAAGRVMATVAAKVQEVIPPAGKGGSTTSFLVQEDNGSAGTVGSGYVTAGSEPRRESGLNEDQEQADRNLFSPQQARRLQEMETEAPLLYAGYEGGTRPVSPSPQLPHSASSSSDQADAIQAEVRKQMQSYLVVQAELQQRVAVLVEENQLLRQVAVSSEVGVEAQGSQAAKGGWFSGIRKNLLGLVHQVPMKSAGVPLAIPEGWALNPPPTQGPQAATMSTTTPPANQNTSLYGLAPPPVVPASLEAQSQRAAMWQSEGGRARLESPFGFRSSQCAKEARCPRRRRRRRQSRCPRRRRRRRQSRCPRRRRRRRQSRCPRRRRRSRRVARCPRCRRRHDARCPRRKRRQSRCPRRRRRHVARCPRRRHRHVA